MSKELIMRILLFNYCYEPVVFKMLEKLHYEHNEIIELSLENYNQLIETFIKNGVSVMIENTGENSRTIFLDKNGKRFRQR